MFPTMMTLSANLLKIHFLEFCQTNLYIIDQLTIQLILSLLTLFSLFLPSTNMSLSEKCNVLLSLMSNNSPMNRFSMLNILPDVKIPVLSVSLFSAESGQASYRKVPCFTVTGSFCKQHIVLNHVFFRYKSPGG